MYDHSMFNFLAEDSSTKKMDLELAKEFAKQAMSAFLGQSKAPLNDTITKIANAENLNSDQVLIVCQESNKMVNTSLFKTAENKYTNFELADASVILSNINGSEKTASANSQNYDQDYNLAPQETEDHFKGFSIIKTAGHAGLNDNSKAINAGRMEKLAHVLKMEEDAIIMSSSSIEASENQFVKIARNQLLPYSLKERRDLFPYITHFCKEAGLQENHTQKLMGYLDKVMVGQGLLEKSADIKADASLISDKLNVRIVNGNHPLHIIVKTIVEKDKKKKLHEENHNIIKDSLADYSADGAILGYKKVKEL